ncbi:MAG TPA: asparagine synthase-related protein [Gemmatimonadaceae bacterium]
MTAILGVIATDGSPTASDGVVWRMLSAMARRGGGQAGIWRQSPAVLAVARQTWELGPGFSGPVLVVEDGDCAVVADASLYYRDDLRRRLSARGIRPRGQTPSHLILAAYRAWGERCPEYLEGDFAFVLYDRRARRVVAARDFGGKRPLFYAELDGALVIASSMHAILAHPDCPGELDLAVVAESMASFIGAGRATCYRAISRLDAGFTLTCTSQRRVRVQRHWEPPVFERPSGVGVDEAADELRDLLGRAVSERLATAGRTVSWVSGGRDSTAVFAAGQHVLHERGDARELVPVSMSYPVGDPGREDELITAVASRWRCDVHWVRIDDVPLLHDPVDGAAAREEPFAHLYEGFNRALAAASRKTGARVALDGIGGDQLFQVSDIFFADLLRTGRWLALAREWRARGRTGQGFRAFFRWAVQPALRAPLLRAAQIVRGGVPLRAELRRRTPEWIDRGFARAHGLADYANTTPRRRRGESVSAAETQWYLTDPYFPTVFGLIAQFAHEAGVEVRSPLYDRRIIDFAATRPREERVTGGETKVLLRRAMRGLIPDDVLASRPVRTGVMSKYFDHWMRSEHAAFLQDELRSPMLAQLGVVDAATLQRACRTFMRWGHGELGLRLFLTLQAELWVRARLGVGDTGAVQAPHRALTAVGSG